MATLSQIEEEVKREIEDDLANDDLYNIKSWGADLSFREIVSMYDENELLKPELQRNYVWSKPEASRFVESVLFGLPIPSIFLAKRRDEKLLIIDGYQRLMTIRDYIKGVFSTDNSVFKLTNSKRINERWKNKAFVELTEAEQRKIKTTTIHSIIFEQVKPSEEDSSLYQVFERINTSGRTLNPQEIRNCVYQGALNSLLIELNTHPSWRTLFGATRPDPRMFDMELILRFLFFATAHDAIISSDRRVILKKALNDFMGSKVNNEPSTLDTLSELFRTTMDYILVNFGEDAFFSISKGRRKLHFHPAIFDAIAVATSLKLKTSAFSTVPANQSADARFNLLTDPDFLRATTEKTTDPVNIGLRVSKAIQYLFT